MRRHVLAVLLVAAGGAACGDDSSTSLPTSPTTTLTFSTEIFVGTLALSGTSTKDFTVIQTGTVSVTLASLLAAGSPVPITVGLGLGTWDATASTCTVTDQTTAAPALEAQLRATLTAGSRCVNLTDPNNLGPVDFAIRVVHP